MISLEKYYKDIIKYDLVNKFSYTNSKKIPKLKKIILSFSSKKIDFKILTSTLLALKLISNRTGQLTVAKKPNLLLKIRKGNPVGCKVMLTKKSMYDFLEKLIFDILPKIKKPLDLKSNPNINTLTFTIENPLIFKELEKNYFLFNSLKNLQIIIISNTTNNNELFFLLNSFKLLYKK